MHLLYVGSIAKPAWQRIEDVKHKKYIYVVSVTVVLDSDGVKMCSGQAHFFK